DLTMKAFERMEEKADRMLDEANSMTELNQKPVDAAEELEAKYGANESSAAVDDELEKLKKEMGL
ncbi:MAG: PspA/IM30 family protein, partial [Floccifex sp.]